MEEITLKVGTRICGEVDGKPVDITITQITISDTPLAADWVTTTPAAGKVKIAGDAPERGTVNDPVAFARERLQGNERAMALLDEVQRGRECRGGKPGAGEWAQDVSDGAPTVRAGSVIEVRDPG